MTDRLEIDKARLEFELERDRKKWRIRRRISVAAFVSNLVAGTLFYLVPWVYNSDQLLILREFNSIAIALIGTNSSIVLLYLGAATYSDSHGNSMTNKER